MKTLSLIEPYAAMSVALGRFVHASSNGGSASETCGGGWGSEMAGMMREKGK